MREPIIHSHITDELPEDHPLSHESIECDKKGCVREFHCWNNECMSTWIETGRGNYCFQCFVDILKEENEEFGMLVLEPEWGLPDVVSVDMNE